VKLIITRFVSPLIGKPISPMTQIGSTTAPEGAVGSDVLATSDNTLHADNNSSVLRAEGDGGAPSGGGVLDNDGLGEAVGGVMGGDDALRAGGTCVLGATDSGGSNDAISAFCADDRLGVGALGMRGALIVGKDGDILRAGDDDGVLRTNGDSGMLGARGGGLGAEGCGILAGVSSDTFGLDI
jgi:hypothetical protein